MPDLVRPNAGIVLSMFEGPKRDGARLVLSGSVTTLQADAVSDYIDVEVTEDRDTVIDLDGWRLAANHLNTNGNGWLVIRSCGVVVWRAQSIRCACDSCVSSHATEVK
jgi:hypothetical protein